MIARPKSQPKRVENGRERSLQSWDFSQAMIWHKTIEAFGVDILKKRGITAIEIAVAEAPMQEARYRRKLAGFAPGAAPIPARAPNAGCGANITPGLS